MKMKKIVDILLITLLMGAVGCNKNEPDESPVTNASITIKATEAGATKALLDKESFAATGNRIQVYDFVTEGTTTTKHIDAFAGPDVNSDSPMHTYGTTWPFEDKQTGTPPCMSGYLALTRSSVGLRRMRIPVRRQ